jgi:hypothetical protein
MDANPESEQIILGKNHHPPVDEHRLFSATSFLSGMKDDFSCFSIFFCESTCFLRD